MLIGITLLIMFLPAIVVLHELGHFWAARCLGIQLTEFSIGLGPVLKKWHRDGIEYSAHLWPVAAHVKPAVFKRDKQIQENPLAQNPKLIQNHPVWHQLLFLAGGAIANISFAYVLLVVRGLSEGVGIGAVLWGSVAELGSWAGFLAARVGSTLFGIGEAGAPLPPLAFDQQLAFLSLSFGLVNLVPVPPFDGGRILVILLRKWSNVKLGKG
jgi:membrane-associated protease RseP (regulator of RpoE activity)